MVHPALVAFTLPDAEGILLQGPLRPFRRQRVADLLRLGAIAQRLLYSKYLNRGKKQGVNAENYLAKAKYWLYAAARNGDETARTCILENRDNINKMRFATVKEAVAGDEFKMAVAEMTQNGYGLSALESDLNKLAALNQFSIKERMFHMMEKERELDEFTTSCYYCYPDIPDSKIGNVLKTYAAG